LEKFFQGFDFGMETFDGELPAKRCQPSSGADYDQISEKLHKEFNVLKTGLVPWAFVYKTNPVRDRRIFEPSLDINNFGLSSADLNTVFDAGKITGPSTLTEIIASRCYILPTHWC
jgi:2-oxoglutarate dehydrogenase E1 component